MSLKFDMADFNNIDFSDVARWPYTLKVIAIIVLCIVVLGAGIWFDTRNQLDLLSKAEKNEQQLKATFTTKQHKAANLEGYKLQMKAMEKTYSTMKRQLPGKTEVEALLVDISQKGLANGLEFELFQPGKEKQAEFYAELPIKIKVVGTYHDFGRFVSAIAALPRIVTLHNFSIKPAKGKGQARLVMVATAKTYRYLEEE